jgi:hypothetical protein
LGFLRDQRVLGNQVRLGLAVTMACRAGIP